MADPTDIPEEDSPGGAKGAAPQDPSPGVRAPDPAAPAGAADDGEWRLDASAQAPALADRARAALAAAAGATADTWRRATSLATDMGRFTARLTRASVRLVAENARAFGVTMRERAVAATRPRPPGAPRAARPFTWGSLAAVAGWSFGGLMAAVVGFFVYVTWGMPSTDDLWEARQSPSITFQDRYGRVLLREGAQNAPPVALDTLPEHVAEAVIAIEDRRFYDHPGVDVEGLTRAVFQNFRSGRVVQGGSTLTQQLAKNLFLTNERTFRRKAQEVAMALWLESKFTKEEILALYLSRVYFGAGAWGIEAASERYFDKPARELSLGESALLAGLLKAPSRMNPAIEDTSAKARALVVLNAMVAEEFITQAERDAAAAASLPISRRNPGGNLGYFRDWIDPLLNQIISDQRDDFIVETTLDLEAQRAAERAMVTELDDQGAKMGVSQGALLSLDAQGGVRAMVGGRSYTDSQFNRTTQARRQPGSSFKYFIYMAAMERPEFSPYTVRVDEPVVIGDWAPGNYEDEYFGPATLAQAFAKSMNMVAIKVANEVGGDAIIDTARRLGVRTRLHNYRSLALGAQELPLIEMTQAYGAMASGGFRIEPHGVARVRRASGNTIWTWRPTEASAERVIDDRTLRSMNYLMSRVVEAGTGTRARIQGRQIGGKTGTGNDYRDAWFVGFTSGITTGVWVGNDNFQTTKKVTGGSIPAQIWRDYMVVALRDAPPTPLLMPKPEDYLPEPSITAATDPNAVPGAVQPVGAPLLIPNGSVPASEQAPSLDGPEG
ncbi:MAG: PBP1A family penicillin-binding protein [Hyphomonadaceae bacterium]|nr:PBP1A family penicillin-binding protein [Hyphomonadaceae bacterium]